MRIVVIGGGIAGVSAAYALASSNNEIDVLVVEAEPVLAHHTTGRSAAQLILNYGAAPIRALSMAGLHFLHNPPPGLVDHPLLEKRSVLSLAGVDQHETADRLLAEGQAINPTVAEISVDEAVGLFPPLRCEVIDRAIIEVDSYDIDVAGLHQAFVRGTRSAGGRIETSSSVEHIERAGGCWRLSLSAKGLGANEFDRTVEADVVINAAGAWGDVVANKAGLVSVGLQPMRRTVFMTPSGHGGSNVWPLVADVDHQWYIKPDGGQFLCSPADEQPSEPCDAKPEEIEIALAIDRINNATTLDIRHVTSSWAGLRTFAPDRSMVIGPDPDEPTFLWCVGQGGTGIQTAPAAGQLVADLTLQGEPGISVARYELDIANLAPARFRRHDHDV